MRSYAVWHAVNPSFLDARLSTMAAFPLGFTHVATVLAEHPDHVFELTNHIDHPWPENPGVTLVGSDRVRSTSVGDVIVETYDGEADLGRRFSVAGFGFTEF